MTCSRKAGNRCGFAASLPQGRITALKMDETSVDLAEAMDAASEVVQKAEPPCEAYPLPPRPRRTRVDVRLSSLTEPSRAASPVLPAPGVGQVGAGLDSSWRLEEEEEDERVSEEDAATEEQEENPPAGGALLEHTPTTERPLTLVFPGDVVEISDSEEEEVVVLHP